MLTKRYTNQKQRNYLYSLIHDYYSKIVQIVMEIRSGKNLYNIETDILDEYIFHLYLVV